jgi:Spy/CpxP family protein refolding chaperone
MGLNDSGRRLDQMTRRLNLTAEQQAKIKPILEEEAGQFKAIDETRLTRDERRDKLQELRNATFDKIQPILTPEQQKKHEALRERMHERRLKRVGGQPAPTVGPK